MLFKDECDFLSNFYPSPIVWKGTSWPTLEHIYQASKCAHPEDEEPIRRAYYPGVAKKMGRQVLIRGDWERVKVEVMADLVWAKFIQNSDLGKKLIATGDIELVEGNYWHDNFWGDCYCRKCGDVLGKNMLGFILMEVRERV